MNDALFDRFASPTNLKQAFVFVRSEISRSSLPLDPFWVPGMKAIEKLGDAFFESLSKLIIDDRYLPDENCTFHQHKQNFGIRRLALITMIDRVVYQALLNPDILGNQLTNKRSKLSLYPGVSKSTNHYLEQYQDNYKSFWKMQRSYFDDAGMNYRAEYDAHSFYDNISHKKLIELMEGKRIGTSKLRSLLLKMLSCWYGTGRGIPQGPDSSSILANYYLDTVDSAFGGSESGIGYVRYMDDMIFMAKSNNQLMKAVETLTELLDSLGLDLNSKTKIEIIESGTYFDDKGIEHPYLDHESFNDWVHSEGVKVGAESALDKLSEGIDLDKKDISTLKYHLKTTSDYSFAKRIFSYYPQLPPLADLVARYVQPYGSEKWVQTAILDMFGKNHLFRWQKLWLAKLILVEQGKNKLSYRRINFCKSGKWELRSMAWLTKSMSDPEAIEPSELIRLMRESENIFELGLYVEASPYLLPDDAVDNYMRDMVKDKSLELQLLVSAKMLNTAQIDLLANSGELFATKKLPLADTVMVAGDLASPIEKILGIASKVSDPKSRYVFEIQAIGKEIIMLGSILRGQTRPAFKSTKPSLYYYVLKELLIRHNSYDPETFQEYLKNDIERKACDGKAVDFVKSKRNLDPLCEILIKYLFDEKINTKADFLRFRRAITLKEFNALPSDVLKEITDLASIL
jgi:hypothetical protein